MLRSRHFALVLTSISACFVASSALADEPVRPTEHRPGEYPPSGTGSTMMLAGAVTTAVWYGGAVGFSYLWPDAPGASDLRIPVAGPWMALADTGCADTNPDCSIFGVILRATLTVIDGVGQAGGLAILAEGALLPTRSQSEPIRQQRISKLPVYITPTVSGRDTLGLRVVGQF